MEKEIEILETTIKEFQEKERQEHTNNEEQQASNNTKINQLREENRRNRSMLQSFAENEPTYIELSQEIEKNEAEISKLEEENRGIINANLQIREGRVHISDREQIEQSKQNVIEGLKQRRRELIINRHVKQEQIDQLEAEQEQITLEEENRENEMADKQEAITLLEENERLSEFVRPYEEIRRLEEEKARLQSDIKAAMNGIEIEKKVAEQSGYTGTLEAKQNMLKNKQDKLQIVSADIASKKNALEISEGEDINVIIDKVQDKYNSNLGKIAAMHQLKDVMTLKNEIKAMQLQGQEATERYNSNNEQLRNLKEIISLKANNGLFAEIEEISACIDSLENMDIRNDVEDTLEGVKKYISNVSERRDNIKETVKNKPKESKAAEVVEEVEEAENATEEETKTETSSNENEKTTEGPKKVDFNKLKEAGKKVVEKSGRKIIEGSKKQINKIKNEKPKQQPKEKAAEEKSGDETKSKKGTNIDFKNIVIPSIANQKNRIHEYTNKMDVADNENKENVTDVNNEVKENTTDTTIDNSNEENVVNNNTQNNEVEPKENLNIVGIKIGRKVCINIMKPDEENIETSTLGGLKLGLSYMSEQYNSKNSARSIEKLELDEDLKEKLDPLVVDVLNKIDRTKKLEKSCLEQYIESVRSNGKSKMDFNIVYDLEELHGRKALDRIKEFFRPPVDQFRETKKIIEQNAKRSSELGEKFEVKGKYRMLKDNFMTNLLRKIKPVKQVEAAKPEQEEQHEENYIHTYVRVNGEVLSNINKVSEQYSEQYKNNDMENTQSDTIIDVEQK